MAEDYLRSMRERRKVRQSQSELSSLVKSPATFSTSFTLPGSANIWVTFPAKSSGILPIFNVRGRSYAVSNPSADIPIHIGWFEKNSVFVLPASALWGYSIYAGDEFGHLNKIATAPDLSLIFSGSNVPGMWYDPADQSTLFQDELGSQPVTTLGQTVGMMLDKRFGGKPGPQLWSDASATLENGATRVDSDSYRIFSATGAEIASVYINALLTVGEWYEVTLNVEAVTTPGLGLRVGDTGPTIPGSTTTGPKRVIYQADITTARIKRAGNATDIQVGNVTYKKLPGNHATQATSTLRPAWLLDSNGFPKLTFGGPGATNTMSTAVIPWSVTDKAFMVAGATKTVATGSYMMIAEIGPIVDTTNGTFGVGAETASGDASRRTWCSVMRGDSAAFIIGAGLYPAPDSKVVSGVFDISGVNEGILRLDAAQVAQVGASNLGTWSDQQLFIGARNGATVQFKGDFYGLCVKAPTTVPNLSEFYAAERLIASRMGKALL